MKKAISILLVMLLLTPPVSATATQNLAPEKTQGDVGTLVANGRLVAVARKLSELQNERNLERRAAIRDQVQKSLDKIEDAQKVRPYWYSLVYNEDGTFEITINYVDEQGRDNLVINRFVPVEEDQYYVEAIKDNVSEITEQRELENILAVLNETEAKLPEGLLQKSPNPLGVLPQTAKALRIEGLPARVTRREYLARAQEPLQNRIAAISQTLEEQRQERLAPNVETVNSWLGLNLDRARAVIPAAFVDEQKQVALPQALAYRKELMREAPKGSPLLYPYLANQQEPVQEALAVVKQAMEKMASPIKAIVVMGMGTESLGSRAVVQAVSPEGIKLVFVNNIANPNIWIEELKGIKPEETLLYVSSETEGLAEALTMANFWSLWEWLIRKVDTKGVAQSLIEKIQGVEDITNVNLVEALGFTTERQLQERELEEKDLLIYTLNRIVLSAQLKSSPLYSFAIQNEIPIVPLPARQFLSALALPISEIEGMPQALRPFTEVFKEENPQHNPVLEAALYAYAGYGHGAGKPVLVAASSNKQLAPVFEWMQSLINERLGKQERGPYLTFAAGEEAATNMMKAPENKVFLVINVGQEKVEVPEGVAAIELNIPGLDVQDLNKLSLFLEEFSIWYSALLDVNPTSKEFAERVEQKFSKRASGFETIAAARQERQEKASFRKELSVAIESPFSETVGTVHEGLMHQLAELTEEDQPLTAAVKIPGTETEFGGLLGIGSYTLSGELEGLAKQTAIQLYVAVKLGKSINPFLIYSASPEAKLLGEFIKYLGSKRMARLKGGILWDVLYGTTDQHSSAQFLGAGSDIAFTTFLHFLQEPLENPPIIKANGLIHERLNGKTPKEVSSLYLEAVRKAISAEGRLVNTIEVPNEGEENLSKLYQLLVRTSELYSRLWEHEDESGVTVGSLVEESELVKIKKEPDRDEFDVIKDNERMTEEPIDLWKVSIPMQIAGLAAKTFVHPQVEEPGLMSEIAAGLKSSYSKFLSRSEVLARIVARLVGKKSSFLNKLAIAPELKEEAKQEFYVFRFEDVIAKAEVGSFRGSLYDEIRIKRANALIAKTIGEIKRTNPKAKVIVYSEDKQFEDKEYRLQAVLDMIDAGDIFDLVVSGSHDKVLSEIVQRNWVRDLVEARDRTVFAAIEAEEGLKAVNVPKEGGFVPFPELATVMQAVLRTKDESGKLNPKDIENILASYRVWLELSGINSKDIDECLRKLERDYLNKGFNFVVSLPIPPTPKAGSVIRQLDKEYEELTESKGYA